MYKKIRIVIVFVYSIVFFFPELVISKCETNTIVEMVNKHVITANNIQDKKNARQKIVQDCGAAVEGVNQCTIKKVINLAEGGKATEEIIKVCK